MVFGLLQVPQSNLEHDPFGGNRKFRTLIGAGLQYILRVAGAIAIASNFRGGSRLAETARRAGIEVFGAVFLAAAVLVIAAFTNDFSIAYIFHHSNRDLDPNWAYSILGWGGYWGWDPGRERFADAVARRHSVSSLGNDAGETRDAEGLGYVAGVLTMRS